MVRRQRKAFILALDGPVDSLYSDKNVRQNQVAHMFTGIVTDIGTVRTVSQPADMRARIGTNYASSEIDLGASIACDGVCLTVIERGQDEHGDWFDVDYSAETLSKTNLSGWQAGHKVNLERSLRLGDEMGGHVVSGHVDGLAKIMLMAEEGGSTRVVLQAPSHLARFIAAKGSVALNGTSLTVNSVQGDNFDVNLIPHTKAVTTWGDVKIGDALNLEIDMLARYVARLAEAQSGAQE